MNRTHNASKGTARNGYSSFLSPSFPFLSLCFSSIPPIHFFPLDPNLKNTRVSYNFLVTELTRFIQETYNYFRFLLCYKIIRRDSGQSSCQIQRHLNFNVTTATSGATKLYRYYLPFFQHVHFDIGNTFNGQTDELQSIESNSGITCNPTEFIYKRAD